MVYDERGPRLSGPPSAGLQVLLVDRSRGPGSKLPTAIGKMSMAVHFQTSASSQASVTGYCLTHIYSSSTHFCRESHDLSKDIFSDALSGIILWAIPANPIRHIVPWPLNHWSIWTPTFCMPYML